MKRLGILCIAIFIVAISGCTSNDDSVVNGKYNKINQTVGSDTVWNNDTCPKCGEPDAEAQTQTDNLLYNKCLKCGYNFISVKPQYLK